MSPKNNDPDLFRVLVYDLSARRGDIVLVPGRGRYIGGSGLAALLFEKYGLPTAAPFDPGQPLIFAIGPATGYFPLMSKTVCGFKSPYNGNYAESHAGGRSALALRFAGFDALVVTGKAARLSTLVVGSRRIELLDVHYLRGADVFTTGKLLRKIAAGASGHRSIMRIGPAGENGSAYACINVDTYRHFGRLGAGAVMGAKNCKALVVMGDGDLALPEDKAYPKLFKDIHDKVTASGMMEKYHNLGTPANVLPLNALKSLPWRNLAATTDPEADKISGEAFAEKLLMHNAACAGCPVGCIHVGMVREMFSASHRFAIHQVAYDHEPNFAAGPMLGVTDPSEVLAINDVADRQGLDIISAGVALAWAVEATQKGLVSEKETEVKLAFGDAAAFKRAMWLLGHKVNDFYAALGQGALVAARQYGGEDFACVLGQEMAGYATGETYFASQTVSFRHSHLDTGAYSYDQKHKEKDVDAVVKFLVDDERERVLLTCLVACLFAREVYKPEVVAAALSCLGHGELAAGIDAAAENARRARWRLKLATGYDPLATRIPKRFAEIETWKGPVDAAYMEALRAGYAAAVLSLGAPLPSA
ncbi:aldehyde ferredoxin oxidoreductase N-terminal domain-containing protein [Solidesulfovibrio sp.]|uniref:aldehyde ferredoxin oxidoreductase N-terminal domain-containing protein n=1 Tax=Solidesulfovibrio sp. TaxID=2910990 RepID=UPI000EC7D599|nr:aldehyde ferredoxin oxidoreductase C-terminal domain-containing protein [Solidesulfovibrio sp.]MEA5090217.1 aldehyde ferredoxin oxidoreductase N-terminal domain-containing protein [Solidesulfovibrio sp.]HCR13727.1 aldehyde ferredoxin oxidoreductase [Desulfovibrio sp.]